MRRDCVLFPFYHRHANALRPVYTIMSQSPISPSSPSINTATLLPPHTSPLLILRSRGLTSLKLIKVPPADREITTVFIHAFPEVGGVRLAHGGRLVIAVSRVLSLIVLCQWLRSLGRWRWSRGATAEKSAEGVADAGADCYAGSSTRHLPKQPTTSALLSWWCLGRGFLLWVRHGGRLAGLWWLLRDGFGGHRRWSWPPGR